VALAAEAVSVAALPAVAVVAVPPVAAVAAAIGDNFPFSIFNFPFSNVHLNHV
jgi:hypothetical protein